MMLDLGRHLAVGISRAARALLGRYSGIAWAPFGCQMGVGQAPLESAA